MMLVSAVYFVLNILDFDSAMESINFDVIVFIMSFLIMTRAVEKSGFFEYEFRRLLSKFTTPRTQFIFLGLFLGFIAATLTNDVAAMIGISIIMSIAKKCKYREILVVFLAFIVTIGSTFSPVGNPQNMLIAVGHISNPFAEFLLYAFIPALISLVLISLVFAKFCDVNFHFEKDNYVRSRDKKDVLTVLIFMVVLLLMFLNDIVRFLGNYTIFGHIAILPLLGAVLILIIRNDRDKILSDTNWGLVLFFIFMFIAVEGILRSQLITIILTTIVSLFGVNLSIIVLPVLFSQIISNVPTVQMILSFLSSINIKLTDEQLITLAFASTVAGNILPFSAASNIIIIEESRRRGIKFRIHHFIFWGLIFFIMELILYLTFLAVIHAL